METWFYGFEGTCTDKLIKWMKLNRHSKEDIIKA
jgi:hypothetical protein